MSPDRLPPPSGLPGARGPGGPSRDWEDPRPVVRRPRPAAGSGAPTRPLLALLVAALLAAGCSITQLPTPEPSEPRPAAPVATLSPAAAAIPPLLVMLGDRQWTLAGYDPTWGPEHAQDRRILLNLAPRVTVERGRTYDLTLRYQSIDPVTAWLPPDFGYIGGSEPVRTEDGFVAQAPATVFIREDALPDLDAGLFGLRAQTSTGPRLFAYPIWVVEPDRLPADVFAGFRLGIANEDGATASRTFVAHVEDDLRRGGGPSVRLFDDRDALMAAYDAGRLDAWIAIPPSWSDLPTTRNGFEAGSRDPETGNPATDTGESYLLGSLIVRALGPAGLIINRGY